MRWRDPVFDAAIAEALAHPWRVAAEALVFVLLLAGLLGVTIVGWGATS